MVFLNPQFFLVLIIPFTIFAFLILTDKDKLSRIFDTKVLERLNANRDALPLVVRNSLLLLSIFLMIVAMSRPIKEIGDKEVEIEGIHLLCALDISTSMRSKDVYPNRLTFSKIKIKQLFDEMATDKVGVVAFAERSFLLSPFSTDKETLKYMLDALNENYINLGSTNFTSLAKLSNSLLEKKEPKILVIFSDGGEDIEKFSSILKENNITPYVVLIGTKKGSPVLKEDGTPLMYNGKIAITQRNDTLGEEAKELDGAYLIAKNGNEDMKELASLLHQKYSSKNQGKVKIKEKIEYFYYPLGGAIFLLLISLISTPQIRRKS